jgi:hypothetical protein
LIWASVSPLALAAFAEAADLPPISWTCPMHPDVVEEKKGKCPICSMDLVPIRLDYVWSCPVHSVVEEDHAGKCPICRRDLVQVTVALTFTCTGNPKVKRLSPGKCADGTPTVPQHTARAHGNHSPQHGGSFFMAPDNWHHLEGTYPEAGLFRVYLYDDYSKPLPLDAMKQINGVVTHTTGTFPLKLAPGGKWLDARIAGLSGTPADLTAKVKFKPGDPEYRFDFTFREFSKDIDASETLLPSQFQSIEIPDKTSDIIALLDQRSRNILALIQKGSFGEIYVDAFQGKDLALALDLRLSELPLAQRAATRKAIESVVRSAWQLDSYGDIGDRKLINEAYSIFAKAVEELVASFSVRRP